MPQTLSSPHSAAPEELLTPLPEDFEDLVWAEPKPESGFSEEAASEEDRADERPSPMAGLRRGSRWERSEPVVPPLPQGPALKDPALKDPALKDPALKDPALKDPALKDDIPRYRRRSIVTRHRRPRKVLKALQLLALAVLLVTMPVAVAAWMLIGPQFRLQTVTVAATKEVPRAWVEEALEPLAGRNLLMLPLGEAQRRLEAHPWVAGAAISKQLPSHLHVEIRQRRPAALGRQPEGWFYLDGAGEAIAPWTPQGDGVEVPRLRIQAVQGTLRLPRDARDALSIAAEVERLGYSWGSRRLDIEVLGEDNFCLRADELPFALLVRKGSLESKVTYLPTLFSEIEARYEHVEAVDLRFERRIVVQPDDGLEAPLAASRLPIRG